MSRTHKLSLWSAIFINLNVMIGGGIFVNTVLLSRNAGGLSAAAYLLVALLILPLIITISRLSKLHAGGNFYDYGLTLGSYFGFLSALSYFIAKLASCALATHVGMSLLQTIFPVLQAAPTLFLDCCVISLFAVLNTLNLRVGKHIQLFFIVCKFIPILFVVLVGLYLFNPTNFSVEHLYPVGMLTSVPFILHAFMGFEVSCSLSRSLQNPEKDGPRAVLIAYGLGVAVVSLFQFLFYGSLGSIFDSLSSYLGAFPALLSLVPHITPYTYMIGKGILHMGIAASVLGAAYGIMYSNLWNLFELAVRGHVVKKALFTRLNLHNIPVFCVLAEAIVVVIYLFLTKGNQVPLQQTAAFGSTIAYTISALALVVLVRRIEKRFALLSLLGLGSCLLLLAFIINNFTVYGFIPALVFMAILLMGSLMYALV